MESEAARVCQSYLRGEGVALTRKLIEVRHSVIFVSAVSGIAMLLLQVVLAWKPLPAIGYPALVVDLVVLASRKGVHAERT